MLKRVRELPGCSAGARADSVVGRDVREFCRNRAYEVAEVTIEGRDGTAIVQMLRRYIRSHRNQCEGVAVCQRNKRAYLYREDVAR